MNKKSRDEDKEISLKLRRQRTPKHCGTLLYPHRRLFPQVYDLVFGHQGGESGGMKDEAPNGQTLLFYFLCTYIIGLITPLSLHQGHILQTVFIVVRLTYRQVRRTKGYRLIPT